MHYAHGSPAIAEVRTWNEHILSFMRSVRVNVRSGETTIQPERSLAVQGADRGETTISGYLKFRAEYMIYDIYGICGANEIGFKLGEAWEFGYCI